MSKYWDRYFMSMVYLVASMSKDKSTHIGAVIVDIDNAIRSTGYNSFPRGINDDVEERYNRPEKYYWFAHGERNAIYNAARMGITLKNCRLYTQAIPCSDCAIGIIQSGITEVIVHGEWSTYLDDKWKEHALRTENMFKEGGVFLRRYNGNIINELNGFADGKIINL